MKLALYNIYVLFGAFFWNTGGYRSQRRHLIIYLLSNQKIWRRGSENLGDTNLTDEQKFLQK